MIGVAGRSGLRAHILAPHGRDAQLAHSLLDAAGIASAICADFEAFVAALDDDTLFGVLTEEAIRSVDLKRLSKKIAEQPSWSDIPFIVLTQRGGGPEKNPNAARASEILGNVTFLERPFHPTTFVSVVRSAAKGRQRQFEVRALIDQAQESEERLQTALLAGRLGAWELDLGTLALSASPTCKALFGRGAEDSFTYADLVSSAHPDDRDRMLQAIEATVNTGVDYAIEYRNVWPDRSVHWVEVRARRMRNPHAITQRLVGVSLDITERKSLETRLLQANETLEQRVSERTRALEQAHKSVLAEMAQRQRAEEQLRQAQKMEMIGQLTGGVAHDFNNLLTAVLGNLELLQKHAAGDVRALRLIDGAIKGAERGASLTQRLLAFARRQDLQLKSIGVDDLVRGIADLLAKSVGSSVELSFELAPAPLFAMVDANQLELALLNLVINARDAMPDGGTISVIVDRAAADGVFLPAGRYVRLVVQDNGLGMDAETLQKAVEPFFSTKELGKGTGLGLSMIHGLALQLRGTLRLSSEIGKGTRAELWLPEADAGVEDAPSDKLPQVASEEAENLTVLVVDDDALISMSTAAMIEDLGHHPLEANSGDEAIEVLNSDARIDLLITDFSMPRMNGAELARQASAIRPGLPILLATGYAELPSGTTVDLPRIGKPFRQEQLQSEIAKLIDASRSSARALS